MNLVELRDRGVELYLVGDDAIRYMGPEAVLTPDYVEEIRFNKPVLLEELLATGNAALMDRSPDTLYPREFPGEEVSESELQEIARRVETEGYVLLWSDVLQDFVAYHKTDADRAKIPAGFSPFSDSELQQLFREDSPGWSVNALRRIHMAKKVGGFKVTDVHDDE